MLKNNNFWIDESVRGLYFGCYTDMMTVKVGQTTKSIFNRAKQIDQSCNEHFIIQYYIPFKNRFEDKRADEIFALAMEDLLHDWMTQFCHTEDFHKYRGEDHYECSNEGCKRFFNYLEEHNEEIKNYFSSCEDKLVLLINKYYNIEMEEKSRRDALVFLLRKFNGVEQEKEIVFSHSIEFFESKTLARYNISFEEFVELPYNIFTSLAIHWGMKEELLQAIKEIPEPYNEDLFENIKFHFFHLLMEKEIREKKA